MTEAVVVCIAFLVPGVAWNTVIFVVLLEGLLLGFGQHLILRNIRPGLESGWFAATIAGTLVGRCVQFASDTGPFAAGVSDWNVAAQTGLGAVLGAVVGGVMALPQAMVLRNRVGRPVWWIAARALAWCIALPSLMLAGGSLTAVSGAAVPVLILVMLMTFGAAAGFVGLVEGIVLQRLLQKSAVALRSKI